MNAAQSSWFNRIAENKLYSIGLLLLFSCFFFIGLGYVHLFDWDEINFAEASREMIKSGDYLHVQINFLPFWEKPPFFFWLQVVAMKLFGIGEFAARFPNALFGFVYLVTFYFIGRKHYSPRFGLMWGVLFAGALLPHLYFKSGIIDPVFNYFIFLSIYFLMRVFSGGGDRIWLFAILAGVCSAISVLTKGPVGFLLFGLTFSVYAIWKRFRGLPNWKYFAYYVLGFATIIGIWVSIEVSKNGWDILMQFIDYQIELFTLPVAGHEQPFYYHFVVVFVGCFPLSIFALPGFWTSQDDSPLDFRRWMLVLFWVVMILFSITTTKIIHYSSMAYAPLSFLAAWSLYRITNGHVKRIRWIRGGFLGLGIALSIIFVAVAVVFLNKEWLIRQSDDLFVIAGLKAAPAWSGWEVIPGILLLVLVIASFILLKREKILNAISLFSFGLGIVLLLVLYQIIPKVEEFSQGPVISFFQEKSNEDCYAITYGLKSYAQYFYFDLEPDARPESKEISWLAYDSIDKPVYFVTRIKDSSLAAYPGFSLDETRGGYHVFKREVP